MNKYMKIIGSIVIMALILAFVFNNKCFAYDDGYSLKELYVEDNYIDDMDSYEYINKKLDDELKTKTGIISEKLEEKLNSKGYFDEDIDRLDEQDIASLEIIDLNNITVLTEYYAIPDTKDSKLMIKLTSKEVDMLIASKYYEVESDLDSVIYERTKLDYVGEPSYDKGQVRYAFLKKSLILLKTNYYYTEDDVKKNYYELIESLTFVKMPVNRLTDEYEIYMEGLCLEETIAVPEEEWREQGIDKEYISPTVTKLYDEEKYLIKKGNKEGYTLTKNIKRELLNAETIGVRNEKLSAGQFMAISQEICGLNTLQNDKVDSTNNGKEYTNYYNETIKIRAYLRTYGSHNTVVIGENYKHAATEAKKDNIFHNKFLYTGVAVVAVIVVLVNIRRIRK